MCSSADKQRKIGKEYKTPKTGLDLYAGSFWIETLVTHLGHNCIATASIAGDKVTVLWTVRRDDGTIELHKAGEGKQLFTLTQNEFVYFITMLVSLVADPYPPEDAEPPLRQPEPSVGQIPELPSDDSDSDSELSVGSSLIEVEDLKIPRDIWTTTRIKATDGSEYIINRLRDDLDSDILARYR